MAPEVMTPSFVVNSGVDFINLVFWAVASLGAVGMTWGFGSKHKEAARLANIARDEALAALVEKTKEFDYVQARLHAHITGEKIGNREFAATEIARHLQTTFKAVTPENRPSARETAAATAKSVAEPFSRTGSIGG